MKIKLPEHDHKLTNILKVLLFSLLMLLPFLDIGTRCGYVLLNKNAYQSYSMTNNINIIDTTNATAISGNTLYISYDTEEGDYNYSPQFWYSYISFDPKDYVNVNISYEPDAIQVYTGGALRLHNPNNNTWTSYTGKNGTIIWGDVITNFTVNLTQNIANAFKGGHARLQNIYLSQGTIDNVFDYSIDKMANSPLYNWTTQTGMYTGVNAMTTGLGITTPLFAILITYWMFLTIIYIILDIVLSLFTFMTHIFTKKE